MLTYIINIFTSLLFFCSTFAAASESGLLTDVNSPLENKVHVVVAMPYRPNMPLDPHWYTEDFVPYIRDLLPSKCYHVTGYFISLENISQFIDDMKALHDKNEKICILNFCDGGEWDGYPGISVLRKWEQHRVSRFIPMSGGDARFIYNSDDKAKMQSYIAQAGINPLPQALVPSLTLSETDFLALLEKEGLDKSWPLFCKLNIGAGALGISASSICRNIAELKIQIDKIHAAFPTSDILIQPYLPGPEYTVLVLKDRVYAAVRRDFNNFYNLMQEDYLTGTNAVEDEITYYPAPEHVQKLALNAIQAIPGTHHYTRVDLRGDGKGNTYVLDINDRPGFGDPSTVKTMLDYCKLNEAKLLLDIIETCSIKVQACP